MPACPLCGCELITRRGLLICRECRASWHASGRFAFWHLEDQCRAVTGAPVRRRCILNAHHWAPTHNDGDAEWQE